MTKPKKIVVVDDEASVCRLVQTALQGPDFEVHSFVDAREALAKLGEIAPDLIVCDLIMPVTDGRSFFRSVKRSRRLKDVPFIFLSAVDVSEEIVSLLDEGADDFVSKPFEVRRLAAKIRATLRMSERLGSLERRRDMLSGSVGPGGTLPLIKFCESSRLTGRLSLESAGQRRWVEFLGGELIRAGEDPESGEDPLDALLQQTSGSYLIAQKRLDAAALEQAEPQPIDAGNRTSPMGDFQPMVQGGRLSGLELRGQAIQIQTEGKNRPNFMATTVVLRGGRILRKIESAWPFPLQRQEDVEPARVHLDRQHERVVATLKGLAEGGGAANAGAADLPLLAWAVSFVAEQVREHVGGVLAVVLLRRAHERLRKHHPGIEVFRISDDGRVLAEPHVAAETFPENLLVGDVARWLAVFLQEATAVASGVQKVQPRQATTMMEAQLRAIGFHDALDREIARLRAAPAR